ncbi:hypothetical protein VTJ83DRAFT_2731 [Remersonia thermophila]|uniref:Acyl-coenzyme A diphosphatase SCS3 n=1 Tax=Remersonia thermophila TaxID=72144 RepID=A0ABR4DJS3_9PEZI
MASQSSSSHNRDHSRSRRSSPPPAGPSLSTQPTHHGNGTSTYQQRNPWLPTRTELVLLAVFPSLLLFGALFSFISPETRSVSHDPVSAAYPPHLAPSYFARKDNLLNVLFVKRGWAWITVSLFAWVFTSPAYSPPPRVVGLVTAGGGLRPGAVIRWLMVTGWWVLVTQWCFGPAIVDRGFRWTGGRCEAAQDRLALVIEEGEVSVKEVFTAAACRASGGKWRGGHDISGHVFLLVLGSVFLLQEVGWATALWAGWLKEERCVVMPDGAVKSASVEAMPTEGWDGPAPPSASKALGWGGKLAGAVVVLGVWMMLMTAIYFHTWFEKLTGLLFAAAGLYATYILPRGIPALRRVVGLPGI